MNKNEHQFLRFIFAVLLFLALSACSTPKPADESSENDIINLERIKADISQLEGEEFQLAIELTEETINANSEDELKGNLLGISRFLFDNRCLVYLPNRGQDAILAPLEYDNNSNLLLLYSKDGAKWRFDTAFTTYPDFEQIESSEYFLASSQRCVEGRGEWYSAIMKVSQSNELDKVLDFESFDVEMYLDFILPDSRELVVRRIGAEIKQETEILEYVWNEQKLNKIRLKETTSILQAVENDSLIIKTSTLFRTVKIHEQ